jgi:YD repeat-containing protein
VPLSTQYVAAAAPRQGVLVLGDAHGNWVNARRVWNQWQYTVTNVTDDASVPRVAANSWQGNNSQRAQVGLEGLSPFAAPDFSVSSVSVTPTGPGPATITARVGNGGSLQAGAGVAVHFYLGDPAAGGVLLGARTTTRPLSPGEFEDVTLPWDAPVAGQVFVTVNETPPLTPTPSTNLSLLPYTWAQSAGRNNSAVQSNLLAYDGIDGNTATRWNENINGNTDPRDPFFEVRFPYPVNATSVTIQNRGATTIGFRGTGTLTFSNGASIPITLNALGEGTVSFPEQQGITWVRLTDAATASGGAGLSDFIVGGSYVTPPFLTREGRTDNNAGSVVFTPGPGSNPPPVVKAGPDQAVFDGDTVLLNPAAFTDPGPVESHTATIDWGDGLVEPGTVRESDGAGTVSGSHRYAAPGTYPVTVTVTDAAGNSGSDSFQVTVQSATLRQAPIDVMPSDPSVTFANLTGPLPGIGPNQTATFHVRITGKDTPHSFDLLFVRQGSGRLLGSVPVVVNNVYHYPVQAVDADGDPISFRLVSAPARATIDATTGLITWQPDHPGSYPFLVEAADDRGGSTTQPYTVVVTAGEPNHPPTITSPPPATAVVQRDFSYTVTATDPDHDPLSFFLTDAPAKMTIDKATGVITWTPPAGQLGTRHVVVSVLDHRGGQDVQAFDLAVVPDTANQAPMFTRAAPALGNAGALYRYEVTATDADNDRLQFDLSLRPTGMTINPATGVLLWRPTDTQVGVQDVIVRVRDGHGGVTLQPFPITVRQRNAPPVITSAPPPQAVQGLPFEYRVRAQDTADDAITFGLDTFPADMTIDASTGVLHWTPTAGQLGNQTVAVTVADTQGGITTQTFTLAVVAAAANDPPQITSMPRTTVGLGSRYVYQVQAVDPNADPLTYSLPVKPAGMTIDASGLLTWQPTPAQFGPNAVHIRVEDGRGRVAPQDFTIDVTSQPQDLAPGITSTPRVSAVVGQLFAYDLEATDPDHDPLVFSLVTAPRGMSINPELGTLRWQPDSAQLGPADVAVQVLDAQGATSTQRFQVSVRSTDTPPVITSTPPTEGAAGVLSTYAVRAEDHDGDPLTFRLQTPPAGMTIDPTTGLLHWTPSAADVGPNTVTLLADDGLGGTATQTFTLVVADTPANRPPVITSSPSLAGASLMAYQYQVTATDPEGQAVSFLRLQAPAGMVLDPQSGLLTWTPGADQLGPNRVSIGARDPGGATAVQTFTITVADGDRPPAISSTQPPTTATVGLTYRYDIQATDPDSFDNLRVVLDTAPAGMTVERASAGGESPDSFFTRLTWSPGLADIGSHPVTLRVLDDHGLSAPQSFQVTVSADTEAPVVSLLASAETVPAGSPVTLAVTASDNVGVAALGLTVNGAPVALDAGGRATVTLQPAGPIQVVATATDAAGNAGSTTKTLLATDPTVTGAPKVDLITPADGDTVTHPVDVIGTVSDTNLVSWTLSVGTSDGTFTEIAHGTTPVKDGVLGRFDPTLLSNDDYILRLTAVNTGGKTATIDREVSVAGNLKLGNFTLSFTDLTVPVSGIPITVTRTYDTLTANSSSDFGYGWRLELGDTRLHAFVPATGSESVGVFSPFRDGTRVYLTVPGGKREGFTFQPTPITLFHTTFYQPHFVADPDVTDTLTVPGEVANTGLLAGFKDLAGAGGALTLFQADDGSYRNDQQIPYNPADDLFGGKYFLITKEGIKYQVNGLTGRLDRVSDTNDNVLTFSSSGVASSAELAITFERDARGRITALTDPMGNRIRYEYDARGDLTAATDRGGNATHFVYSTARVHYLQEVLDRLGRTGARTEYDDKGRLFRVIDANGNPVGLMYDPTHSVETVHDQLGNPTTYEYDERGNIVTQTDALGGIIHRTYHADNTLQSQTDRLGNATTYTYDAAGNLLTQTAPLGNTTHYTYGRFGRALTTTDPLGNTTTNTYDPRGNLLSTTDAAGNVTTFTYDGAGNTTSVVDANGNLTYTLYDSRGQVLQTRQQARDAAGNVQWLVTRSVYDASGRVSVTTDPYLEGGNETIWGTHTHYDNEGRPTKADRLKGVQIDLVSSDTALTSVLTSAGTVVSETSTTYDKLGREVVSKDRMGAETRSTYNQAGKLVETRTQARDENGTLVWRLTRTTYDERGLPRVATDPYLMSADGTETVLTPTVTGTRTVYDAVGHVIKTRRLHGAVVNLVAGETSVATEGTVVSTTTTVYDNMKGLVVQTTDAAGRTLDYEYDTLGQRTAVIDQPVTIDGETIRARTETEYDKLGQAALKRTNVKQRADGSIDRTQAHEMTYQYDGLGRRTRVTFADGTFTETQYDQQGRVMAEIDPLGLTKSYEYDAQGRLSAVVLPKVPDPNDGGQLTHPQYEYRYDVRGNQASIRDPLYGHAGVDPDSQRQTTMKYDERGNLLARILPDGTAETFTYDDFGRQTLHISFEGVVTQSLYDDRTASGGRLVEQRFFATLADYNNGLGTPAEMMTFVYDAFGRQVKVTHSRGAAQEVWTTEYDAEGRVRRIVSPQGAVNYEFDPATGLRTRVFTGATDSYEGDQADPVNDFRYEYDTLQRLTKVTVFERNQVALPPTGRETTTYYYDLVGNLARQTTPDGVIAIYAYDRLDHLTALTQYEPDATPTDLSDNPKLAEFDYTLRPDGARSGATETFWFDDGHGAPGPHTNHLTWTYDNLGRLTDEVFDHYDDRLDQTQHFTYDLAGNRLLRTVDQGNNATIDQGFTYSYDVNDRLLTEDADLNNDGTVDRTTAYGYTASQQTAKRVKDDAAGVVTQATTFRYNLQGEMSEVLVDSFNSSGAAL